MSNEIKVKEAVQRLADSLIHAQRDQVFTDNQAQHLYSGLKAVLSLLVGWHSLIPGSMKTEEIYDSELNKVIKALGWK